MKLKIKGFTLAEILVVLAIGATLSVTLYQMFSEIWNTYNKGSIIIDLDRSSRIVLEYLKKDLREACTSGSSGFFGLLVQDPDKSMFGIPKDCWGQRSYTHGYTLKFHKFINPGDPKATDEEKRRPQAALIQYSFVPNYLYKGRKYKAVIRYQDTDCDLSNGAQKKVLAKFPQKSKAFLYFVKFSVGEVSPEMVKNKDAQSTQLGTGGMNFIRIYFVAEIRIKKRVEHVPLMLVVGPRQINSYLKDPYWNMGTNSMVRIEKELEPTEK